MADDDAPKTTYEIILERLKRQDREEGVEERPLTDEQRARRPVAFAGGYSQLVVPRVAKAYFDIYRKNGLHYYMTNVYMRP